MRGGLTGSTEPAVRPEYPPAYPIVAIGASAGGLGPLRQLFSCLPADTGMAFIVIQHLDPAYPSILSSVLGGHVRMSVVEVGDGMRTEPNHVYVIPPHADLTIRQGCLGLVPRHGQVPGKLHLPIDSFFRALAEDAPGRAIGVVLSGSASDGTDGLRAIKAAGGITLVQEPDSAHFPSMPDSALSAGVVDFRSSPEGIAGELVRLSRHPYLSGPSAAPTESPSASQANVPEKSDGAGAGPPAPAKALAAPEDDATLARMVASIRRHAQLDFRGYKKPTLMRRIARRMALGRFSSLEEYAERIAQDVVEANTLAQEILIHVTSFFRDDVAFESLKLHVWPALLASKGADEDATFRLWIPGCSTGEEAYSVAISLVEFLSEQRRPLSIKVFGSDLSDRAIEVARAGVYTEAGIAGVSPERLDRFFERIEGRYRIGKQVRDLCVFVRHDLTRDPPFAKLDLISCRNVLIYFAPALQRRILPLFHHCLNKSLGYLFLGCSEGLRELDALFTPIDKENRIFVKTGESPRIEYPMAFGREAEANLPALGMTQRPQPAREAQRLADRLLSARYAPPGVVVNERFDVIQFRGHTGDFLEASPGPPQLNVLHMARAGLAGPLRDALEAARAQSLAIRRQDLQITDGAEQAPLHFDLEVIPLPRAVPAGESFFLVVFEGSSERVGVHEALPNPAVRESFDEAARVRAELTATQDYLQALAREHQDTAEELGATNEELIAANEELQSTNEELQSAKEELQSTNEELITLNDELNDRNRQLDLAVNDLANVLESVQIPVIMVDGALRVRRFTHAARDVSNLLPGDVGRSIEDLKLKINLENLSGDIRETIASLAPREREVQSIDGRWFRLHIRPYRTVGGALDGAVLSFLDVDVLKRAVENAERARDYAQSIVETVPISLVVLDSSLRIVSANPPFYQTFARSVPAEPSPSAPVELFALEAGALDIPELRAAAERSLSQRMPFRALEIACTLPQEGRVQRDLVVAGCPIQSTNGDLMLLLAIEDVTERHLLAASEKRSRVDAEEANSAKDLFLATLSHELRTPLNTILLSAHSLGKAAVHDPIIRQVRESIERAVGNQAKLIEDLLDISRIVSGKLLLDLQAVDLAAVVMSAADVARPLAEAKRVGLEVTIGAPARSIFGDPLRLQQVVANLLGNSIKFTPPGGRIFVELEVDGRNAKLTVRDTGLGLDPKVIPRLFERFVQAESSLTRAFGGLGLGLTIVRHIIDVHGGEVTASSPGEGKGSTFTVTLPMHKRISYTAAAVRRTSALSIRGVEVLLIEDDEDTRSACAHMLEEEGANVRAVRSAVEAWTALEALRPRVILCDVAMPGEDGYTFIRRLRSVERGRGIPAAALTAFAGEEDRRRALEAGFQMHLAKPIHCDRLIAAVATLAAWRAEAESDIGASPSTH